MIHNMGIYFLMRFEERSGASVVSGAERRDTPSSAKSYDLVVRARREHGESG